MISTRNHIVYGINWLMVGKSRDQLELRVKKRTEELETANEKLRLVPSLLIEAQENESKRLASDLHDSIAQTLVALKVRVEHIINVIGDGRLKETQRLLGDLVPSCRALSTKPATIYMGLRPTLLAYHGILATLEWHRQQLLGINPKQHIELETAIKEDEIPEVIKIPIFRITQEALNNALKHSRAEWVDVRLGINSGKIELEIAADGIGMDLNYILESSTARSLGLTSMKERAELTGTDFLIISAPNRGTTIKAVREAVPPAGVSPRAAVPPDRVSLAPAHGQFPCGPGFPACRVELPKGTGDEAKTAPSPQGRQR